MKRAVIDENLPRRFGAAFESFGFKVLDVRDFGLRGFDDAEVFKFARTKKAAVATADLEFARLIHFGQSKHSGVFLVRLPSFLSLDQRSHELKVALSKVDLNDIVNCLIVIAPGVVRMNRRS